MSFSVRVVDAAHRPALYAEIEYAEELVAEAFVEQGDMRVAFVDLEGGQLWAAEVKDLESALEQARQELVRLGLLE